MNVRAALVDDEPLARRHLQDMLCDISWINCVGEAADGAAAVHLINRLAPDLVFLDVKMPELNGLQVLERVTCDLSVIFTTAHDQYAVAAFELQALDYLVKPFGHKRLTLALERARGTFGQSAGSRTAERARDAIADSGPLARIWIRDRGKIMPVSTRDVERLEAEGDYVGVEVGGQRHLVHLPLKEFEKRLDPERFLRIHRSHIVNLDFVRHLAPFDDKRLQVEMHDGTKLIVSRARSKELRHRSL